jgi:hypothetical protein
MTPRSVIPVQTGIQALHYIKRLWIPAGVYPDENRGRNDKNVGEPRCTPFLLHSPISFFFWPKSHMEDPECRQHQHNASDQNQWF